MVAPFWYTGLQGYSITCLIVWLRQPLVLGENTMAGGIVTVTVISAKPKP